MAGKFVIRETAAGVHFDLKAGNGEVILNSKVYNNLVACKKGIESVKRNAPNASVEDQTIAGFVSEKNPKFEISLDKTGEYRFIFKADDGHVIGTSERYKAKAGCQNGIESIKRNSVEAKVEEKE